MAELNTLELVPTHRGPDNGYPGENRDFYDFVVDGISLSQLLGGEVTCLWLPLPNPGTFHAARRLLLEIPSDFPNNRSALFVCPQCGDAGCGVVSAVIERDETTFIWREFASQNNYEDEVHFYPRYDRLGIFKFDRTLYEQLLRKVIAEAE